MLIKVFCNGNGNHMIRKRIFPFHYDGRVLLRCELCDLDFVTSRERWQLAEETITSHSVDLYLEDIHAARLRHPSRNQGNDHEYATTRSRPAPCEYSPMPAPS